MGRSSSATAAASRVSRDFDYSSLFYEAQENVEHPLSSGDRRVFEALRTNNFEAALSALRTAELVCRALGMDVDTIHRRHDSVRVALMEAVRGRHVPWRQLSEQVLATMRNELMRHSFVFTTNYDLLVYWAIMSADPSPFRDYFWGSCGSHGDWVCFDVNDTDVEETSTKVLYVHGALHLVELPGGQTAKRTARDDAGPLETFALPDPEEKYPVVPLVITEGSSEDKLEAIRRSDYLSFGYERLKTVPGPLTIFGHSLGEQDQHLSHAVIEAEKERAIAVSICAFSDDEAIERKLALKMKFPRADLRFFDSESHPLGSRVSNVGRQLGDGLHQESSYIRPPDEPLLPSRSA